MKVNIDEDTFKHIKIGMISLLRLNGIIHPRVKLKVPCKVSFDAGWNAAKEYYGIDDSCGNRCPAAPHVGKSCSTGYHTDNLAGSDWVTTKTDDDASDDATAQAVKAWNTRAPNAEVSGPQGPA